MVKIRLLLLGLVIVSVISAVTANSATAHKFKVAGKGITKIFHEEDISSEVRLEFFVAGIKMAIVCKKVGSTGEIETEGNSKGTTKYEECSLQNEKGENFSGCIIQEPIEAHIKGKLIGKEESETRKPVENQISPLEGKELVNIEIKTNNEPKCPISGQLPVTGSQDCKLPGGETEKTEHEIECTSAGSKLFLGKEKIKFTSTEKVKLTTKERWSMM
jgi:hypothetical protein